MLSEQAKEQLVAGMVGAGQAPERARLVVDLAVRASERAFESLEIAAQAAPDPAIQLGVLELALQLVAQMAAQRFEVMLEVFGADSQMVRAATVVEL